MSEPNFEGFKKISDFIWVWKLQTLQTSVLQLSPVEQKQTLPGYNSPSGNCIFASWHPSSPPTFLAHLLLYLRGAVTSSTRIKDKFGLSDYKYH